MKAPSVAGVVGWVLGLFGFLVGSRPLADNSVFTHLATGRLILDGGIPRHDPYSFTAPGEAWVVQSWLVSTLYAAVERLAGLDGVRVVAGLLVAAVVALTWSLTAAARTLAPRCAVMSLVIAASHPFWSPRPLILGLVLLALVLVIAQSGADPRLLVPIMWVWVNTHGSFVLGPLVLGCLAVGAHLDRNRGREQWRPLGWALAGTLAGAISPLGPKLLLFPLDLMDRIEILSRVPEWRSPDFRDLFARAFLLQLVVSVLVLVRRPSYRAAIPLVVFGVLALLARRSIPHASLVMVPGLAAGLAGLGRLGGRERSPVLGGLVAVLAAGALVLARTSLARADVELHTYPVDALVWLDRRGVPAGGGGEIRLATEDTTGNLLELLHGRDARVFFDDRYDMYPLEVSRDYLDLYDGSSQWEQVLDEHRVGYLLWRRASPLAALVASSPRWRVLYQDPTAFVACRRPAPGAEGGATGAAGVTGCSQPDGG